MSKEINNNYKSMNRQLAKYFVLVALYDNFLCLGHQLRKIVRFWLFCVVHFLTEINY